MNALRLALVAAGVTLLAASDFGAKECQAKTYYSVQVQTQYWWSPAYADSYTEHWETIETMTDRKQAYRVRDNIEKLMKTDYWKLNKIMQDIYGFPANAQYVGVRIVEWEYWNWQMETIPIEALP